jgi:copper homeostasis protein
VTVRVEISVESVGGVVVAARGGVDRVELCAALGDGGLTPSAGLIEEAVARAGRTGVHVLVRPRPGDFRYTATEIAVMRRDIVVARDLGAAGVVFGVLNAGGGVDDACADLLAAAGDLETTFHRAIDVSANSERALDRLIELGFTRVLTSGRARSVLDGADLIRELNTRAAGRVQVMACGGVRAANAAEVLARTGVRDLHAAVRTPVRGAADELFTGVGVPEGFDRFDTDIGGIAELRAAARVG